jgi:hypothetical protein
MIRRLLFAAFCGGFALCLLNGCGGGDTGGFKAQGTSTVKLKPLPDPAPPGGGAAKGGQKGGVGSQ